jgi:quercetin dioxygenase-like cupin family protein
VGFSGSHDLDELLGCFGFKVPGKRKTMSEQASMSFASRHTSLVNSQRANQFDWGSIQWLVSGDLMKNAQITFGYVQIEPGQKNPKHYHPNSDEVLYLLEGELQHSLGEEVVTLQPGMAIFIPQGVAHDAINAGTSTARMVVAYPTGDRQMVPLEEGEDS